MGRTLVETARLRVRPLKFSDFTSLASMLRDRRVMYSWEHCFTDEEIGRWIARSEASHATCGLGWFALEEKNKGVIVGQAALMPDEVNGVRCYEVSYMLRYEYWHCGYAREATAALVHYAASVLKLPYVIFEIRPENEPSRRVAESLGAEVVGSFIKPYHGKGMLHLVYRLMF